MPRKCDDWTIWDDEGVRIKQGTIVATGDDTLDLFQFFRIESVERFGNTPGSSARLVCDLLQLTAARRRHDLFTCRTMDWMLFTLKKKLGDALNMNDSVDTNRSLLHVAIENGKPEAVQLLLAHGADPDFENGHSTPWEYFLKHMQPSKDIVESSLPYHDIDGYDRCTLYLYREIRAIFDLHRLSGLHSMDRMVVSCSESSSTSSVQTMSTEPSELTKFARVIDGDYHQTAWVHVPQNSVSKPPYMSYIISLISKAPVVVAILRVLGGKLIENDTGRRRDWLIREVLDNLATSAVVAGSPELNYRDATYSPSSFPSGDVSNIIVFPWLTLQNFQEWKRKKTRFKEDNQFVASKGSNTQDTKTGIYFERTLDEAYYPGLDDELLNLRNEDQVVQNQVRMDAKRGGSHPTALPILLVPQLWIWRIHNVLVSACPIFQPSMLPNHWDSDVPFSDQPDNSGFLELSIAIVLKDVIDSFGQAYVDPISLARFPSTFDLFENAVVATLSRVRTYMRGRESRDIDIDEERRLIESIADIQNELDMIETIIDQQREILYAFLKDVSERSKKREQEVKRDLEILEERQSRLKGSELEEAQRGTRVFKDNERTASYSLHQVARVLKQALYRIDQYTKRNAKINRDAGRVAKTIDDMLNLSRTDASIRLSESSIKEARFSALIGLAALGFAIVTIIFTPLNFVASYLALPINEPNSETRYYNTGYVMRTFVGAGFGTVAFTAVCIYVAYFSVKRYDLHKLNKKQQKNSSERTEGNVGSLIGQEQHQAKPVVQPATDSRKQAGTRSTSSISAEQTVRRSNSRKAEPQPRGDENV